VNFLHKIITPGHAQDWTKTGQQSYEGTGLDRTGMYQIGLNLAYDSPQTEDILWQIQPAEFTLPACPSDDLHTFRYGAVLGLPQVTF
jgi:hypothetical protein